MTEPIPFTLSTSGLIILPIVVNLESRIYLALDTGCTHTMFTTETARELGLLKGATSTQVFTASDKIKAKQQKASYLSIFEHTVEDIELVFWDIDVEVNEYVGYLGLDFLNQFKDLSINFENQQITLTK
jgi:predicted aspartyl protease